MGNLLHKGRGATLIEQLISLGLIKESLADKSKPTDTVTKNKNTGINVSHWFWAAIGDMSTRPAPARKDVSTNESADAPLATSSQSTDEISKILMDNPGINAPTFYNLLKSKGWKFVAPDFSKGTEEDFAPSKEADAASAQPAGIFAGTNPLKKKKEASGGMRFRARMIESTTRSDTAKQGFAFKCVLLQEGMGNFQDQFYYSREAIESAVPIFEGKKIYADHPAADEEQVRPERSVRDILGHFENVAVEETDGIAQLVGDVRVMPDQSYEWARALMRQAVQYSEKYPDKDFVGLSINAGGDAEEKNLTEAMGAAPEAAKLKLAEAKDKGIERVNWVSRITEAVSCDLVTEAGAGGKVLAMLESEKTQEEKKMSKKVKAKEADEKAVKMQQAEDEAAPHSDEKQDRDLIKQMLDEYLGKEDHSEETYSAAKEAHQAAIEMGEDESEALKTAGKMMKMARHMASKKKVESEKCESADKDADDKEAPKQEEEKCKEDEAKSVCESKDEADVKESNIKLQGENAALKEKLAVFENEKFLDKLFHESKLPNRLTKKFREALGEKLPSSQKEIETKFKLFREGLKAADDGEGLNGLVIQQEKTGEATSTLDFSDCTI